MRSSPSGRIVTCDHFREEPPVDDDDGLGWVAWLVVVVVLAVLLVATGAELLALAPR